MAAAASISMARDLADSMGVGLHGGTDGGVHGMKIDMDRFVCRLEWASGRDNETLFGAPYDFRYAMASPGHPSRAGDAFFARLKGLMEWASRRNRGASIPRMCEE